MAASIDDCKMIELPRISDPRGNLTVVEGMKEVPFDIKRIFYVYDVPTGEKRGAHAHRRLHQFLICLSGSLDVQLDDGHRQRSVRLHRPWVGLWVPPMIWAAQGEYDAGTVCLVLASESFDPKEYIRDYDEFLALARRP